MKFRWGTSSTRDRGAVIPLTAMLLAVIVLAVAFAVDLGRQRSERRDMQAVADVVSLDLSRKLQGRDAVTIDNDPAFDQAVDESTARNDHASPTIPCPTGDISGRCLTVTLGNWDEVASAFTACPLVGDPARATCFPDAVEVLAGIDVDYRFQPGSGDTRRSAISRVGESARGQFQIGSNLVSINPASNSAIGQILNSVAPGAQLLGYQGLANANVSLQQLGIALGIPITTASPDELLNTQVTYRQLALATATALQNSGGEAADVQVLNDFNTLTVSEASFSLGQALGVAANGGSPAATGYVNAAQFLTSSVFLVTGTHAVSIPNTALGIPGVTSIDMTLTGIEAPQKSETFDGGRADTSQIDIALTANLDIDSGAISQQLCGLPTDERNILTNTLGLVINFALCTVTPALVTSNLNIRLLGSETLDIDLAEVEAVQALDCDNATMTVTPTPSVVDVAGTFDLDVITTLGSYTFNTATMSVPVTAQTVGASPATAFVGDAPGVPLPTGTRYETFTPPDASVGSNPIGLSNMLNVGSASLTLLRADLSNFTNIVRTRAQNLLNNRLAQIDTIVIQRLARILGLNLGGSDIVPLWMECDESAVLLVD